MISLNLSPFYCIQDLHLSATRRDITAALLRQYPNLIENVNYSSGISLTTSLCLYHLKKLVLPMDEALCNTAPVRNIELPVFDIFELTCLPRIQSYSLLPLPASIIKHFVTNYLQLWYLSPSKYWNSNGHLSIYVNYSDTPYPISKYSTLRNGPVTRLHPTPFAHWHPVQMKATMGRLDLYFDSVGMTNACRVPPSGTLAWTHDAIDTQRLLFSFFYDSRLIIYRFYCSVEENPYLL